MTNSATVSHTVSSATKKISLAYLNTLYPALSHTFIEREIRELRQRGLDIHTFSIRRPTAEGLLSAHDREAAKETFYLLDGSLCLLMTLLASLANPIALLRVFIASQRLAPAGLKSRINHIAYAVEGIRLAREMRRRKLSHVHVHMANNGAAVALLATKFIPTLHYSLSIHGSAEFFRIDSWTLKPKAENAAFVRCISNFCRAQVMTWTDPSAWSRYHIVHCGVDVDAFAPRPPKGEGPLEIITIGRVEAIKGYPVLLEACQQLSDAGVDWRLNMVGNGPLLPFLKELARKLGVEERIIFAGAVGQDELQQHINRADVMVISSFMEGVPVVLMEAMAKQLVVIATKVGGIPELIDDQLDGLLVITGSAEPLAAALKQASKSTQFRTLMGRAARQKITEEFNLSQTGQAMALLFSRYCGGAVDELVPPELLRHSLNTPTMVESG